MASVWCCAAANEVKGQVRTHAPQPPERIFTPLKTPIATTFPDHPSQNDRWHLQIVETRVTDPNHPMPADHIS
jgi:hypothetical protein